MCPFFLDLQLGDFGLQFPDVSVCGFVLLSLVNLSANQFDLLLNCGHDKTLQSERSAAHSSMLLPTHP